MATIMYVRIKSDLDPEELERRVNERKSRFLEVPGLIQKMYGRDETTGDICGIYFFENREALAAFRESELAKTIATAYAATDIRREVYDLLFPLRPEAGLLRESPSRPTQ
jgi:hypothetical protein